MLNMEGMMSSMAMQGIFLLEVIRCFKLVWMEAKTWRMSMEGVMRLVCWLDMSWQSVSGVARVGLSSMLAAVAELMRCERVMIDWASSLVDGAGVMPCTLHRTR